MPANQDKAREAAQCAAGAAYGLGTVSGPQKNHWLEILTESLLRHTDEIVDLSSRGPKPVNLPDQLPGKNLTPGTIADLARTARNLAGLGDPVGRIDSTWLRPNGLKIEKVRIPIGAVTFVYPPCPLFTVYAATVAVKAGNAAVLCIRGNLDPGHLFLVDLMIQAAKEVGLPNHAIQSLVWSEVSDLAALLQSPESIDLAVIQTDDTTSMAITEMASVPTLLCTSGVTPIYIDEEAELETAASIVDDVLAGDSCPFGASLLILTHKRITETFADILESMVADLDSETHELCSVDSVEEATRIIAERNVGHSAAIVSSDRATAARFSSLVDMPCIYVNASPRFTDSAEFGMGAGIGLSTSRIHARGPLGIDEMTTYKYVVTGTGQTRG